MEQQPSWMIYGANGYSGKLIAEEAKKRGLSPVLAGRSEASIRPLAAELGFTWRAFRLDDPAEVAQNIKGLSLILHCAGPFSETSKPMVDACLREKVSYLDITGEISVFEAIFERDQEAKDAGIVLLPGVGFDVVPTDCLAAMLAQKMPEAHELTLAFKGGGSASAGTAKTSLERIPQGGAIRRGKVITRVPLLHKTRFVKFPSGEYLCGCIPWGDVSTAFYSTKIPNIAVYRSMKRSSIVLAKTARIFAPLLGIGFVQDAIKRQIEKRAGPSQREREQKRTEIWGEVLNRAGMRLSGTMITPSGYLTTVLTALACVDGVLRGTVTPGAKTPSIAFGPEFVLQIPGVSAEVR